MRMAVVLVTVCMFAASQVAVNGAESEPGVLQLEHCIPIGVQAVFVGCRTKWIQLSAEEIEATPTWDPASGAPVPLSVGRATRLGTEEFRRLMGDRKGWRLVEVVLLPLCDGHWVYRLLWSAIGLDEIGFVHVHVLLSGKVVSLDRADAIGGVPKR